MAARMLQSHRPTSTKAQADLVHDRPLLQGVQLIACLLPHLEQPIAGDQALPQFMVNRGRGRPRGGMALQRGLS